jgi:hypothetical protein
VLAHGQKVPIKNRRKKLSFNPIPLKQLLPFEEYMQYTICGCVYNIYNIFSMVVFYAEYVENFVSPGQNSVTDCVMCIFCMAVLDYGSAGHILDTA